MNSPESAAKGMIDIWRAKSHRRASLCDLKSATSYLKSHVSRHVTIFLMPISFEWESVDYAVLLLSKKYNSANFKSVSIPTLTVILLF